MSKLATHYESLKISRSATPEIVRAAYKVLSQKHHPDKNPPEQRDECERIMRILNEARDVLSDPSQKASHDSWISRKEAENVKNEQSFHGGSDLFDGDGEDEEEDSDEDDDSSEGGQSGDIDDVFYSSVQPSADKKTREAAFDRDGLALSNVHHEANKKFADNRWVGEISAVISGLLFLSSIWLGEISFWFGFSLACASLAYFQWARSAMESVIPVPGKAIHKLKFYADLNSAHVRTLAIVRHQEDCTAVSISRPPGIGKRFETICIESKSMKVWVYKGLVLVSLGKPFTYFLVSVDNYRISSGKFSDLIDDATEIKDFYVSVIVPNVLTIFSTLQTKDMAQEFKSFWNEQLG